MLAQTLTDIKFAGEVPPASQLPLILWTPRKRRRYRRPRFRMFPEELTAPLFTDTNYSALTIGRC